MELETLNVPDDCYWCGQTTEKTALDAVAYGMVWSVTPVNWEAMEKLNNYWVNSL